MAKTIFEQTSGTYTCLLYTSGNRGKWNCKGDYGTL